MKTKREYIPANIRAGFTAKEAAKIAIVNWASKSLTDFRIEVETFDHGRDVNGNGTSHYKCELIGYSAINGRDYHFLTVVQSGKRREQVGYSGQNEAAMYALEKLGFQVDTSKGGSYDYQGAAIYPLLNFPPVEGY